MCTFHEERKQKRTISIGNQDFEDFIQNDYFYIDKTYFIKEWWESGDKVTLITRPRRFGKILNLSMLHSFFSIEKKKKAFLFQNLSIRKEEKYRKLQGTYPVIHLSFANIKTLDFTNARTMICQLIVNLYNKYDFFKESNFLTKKEKQFFDNVSANMEDGIAFLSIYHLSDYLYRYYQKKVIILFDKYDTPCKKHM